MKRAAVMIVVAACTTEQGDPAMPCSVEGVTGDLPGITIAIRSSACTYRAGVPATFTYDVVVDASAPAIYFPAETNTCTARPHPYTNDPTSLVRSTVYDAQRSWCWDCYFECAPGEGAVTLQLTEGTTTNTLVWPGRAGAPFAEEEVFAPGTYAVRVLLYGGDAGTVAAELPITIEP